MSWCPSWLNFQPEPEYRPYELCPLVSTSGDMSGYNAFLYSPKSSLQANDGAGTSAWCRPIINTHLFFHSDFRGRVMSVKHSKKNDMLPTCCTDCHQQTSLVMTTPNWVHHTRQDKYFPRLYFRTVINFVLNSSSRVLSWRFCHIRTPSEPCNFSHEPQILPSENVDPHL